MTLLMVIGGTNVQFAHDPVSDRIIVIEINPRTSRSSALASKATGFPIALVSAMLATGLTLKDIECGKYGTLDKYVPDGDYVVIKFARWAFEKFKGVEDKLGTRCGAVGEVMSTVRPHKEAFPEGYPNLRQEDTVSATPRTTIQRARMNYCACLHIHQATDISSCTRHSERALQ